MTDPIVDILVHEQYDITQGWDDAAKQIRQQIEPEVVQRCIDAVKQVKPVDINLHQSTNELYYMHEIIKALENSDE